MDRDPAATEPSQPTTVSGGGEVDLATFEDHPPLFVGRRLLRRWPPLALRPEDDGRGNLVFVQHGSSMAVGTLAAGVVFTCTGPVFWWITGWWDAWEPLLISGAGVACLVAAVLLVRSTHRLTLLFREQQVLLQYKLGPLRTEVSRPLARAKLQTHRAHLARRGSLLPAWKGEVVVIAVDDAILFPIAASKRPREINDYLGQLPPQIASLPRVRGPVILSYV